MSSSPPPIWSAPDPQSTQSDIPLTPPPYTYTPGVPGGPNVFQRGWGWAKGSTRNTVIAAVAGGTLGLCLLCSCVGTASSLLAGGGSTPVANGGFTQLPYPTSTVNPNAGTYPPSTFYTPVAGNTDTPTATDTAVPTDTPVPQPNYYPPTTNADLQGLAAQGDASAIHEFHSESVGLTGVCPQPKREVTVDPSITGKQLAADLLAYFYAQGLNNPCGSLVLAYHDQSEANDSYTAGRIVVDVNDASGQGNIDPNGTNLTYIVTLDLGNVYTPQEYMVTYTQ